MIVTINDKPIEGIDTNTPVDLKGGSVESIDTPSIPVINLNIWMNKHRNEVFEDKKAAIIKYLNEEINKLPNGEVFAIMSDCRIQYFQRKEK